MATTLRAKIMLGVSVLILGFGVTITLFIHNTLSRTLMGEFQKHATAMAQHLGARSGEYVLTDSLYALSRLLNEYKENNEDIVYIFVLDSANRVILHTFPSGVPKGLVPANRVERDRSYHAERIGGDGKQIIDIAVGIFEGSAGTIRIGFSEERVRGAIARYTSVSLAVTAGVLLLGLALSYFYSGVITRSLQQLVEAAKAVGRGDLDKMVPSPKDDEVGSLGKVFNEMIAKLKESRDDLLKANEDLETKVRERTKELEKTHMELLQSEKLAAVGQMTACLAHEIGNPMNIVLNYISIIKRRMRSPKTLAIDGEKLQEYMKHIEDEAKRCQRVMHNLLGFVRTEEMKISPAQDVNSLLKECTELIRHQAAMQQVALVNEMEPSLPKIPLDRSQMQQVFINIMLNSLEAMPRGGRLTVSSRIASDFSGNTPPWIEIEFSDTGCGIPEENLPRILDPFFTTKGSEKGTGLGLSIVKGIVKKHHGIIDVRSEVGEGTTVLLRLPGDNGQLGES